MARFCKGKIVEYHLFSGLKLSDAEQALDSMGCNDCPLYKKECHPTTDEGKVEGKGGERIVKTMYVIPG